VNRAIDRRSSSRKWAPRTTHDRELSSIDRVARAIDRGGGAFVQHPRFYDIPARPFNQQVSIAHESREPATHLQPSVLR
jgi:hypothetical protein